MQACSAKYIWTADEYVTAMQRHYSLKVRREFKILLKVTCAILLAFTLFVAFVTIAFPYDKQAPYWSLILVIVICIYGLIYDRINVWYWKRKFLKKPERVENEIEWTFADDTVQMKAPLGEATVKWESYLKIVEVLDGFLFYHTKNLFSWIPFNSIESEQCIGTIREMIIKSKCPYTQQR
jgi:hypothetical protein